MVDRRSLTHLIEKEGGINWWKPELFSKHILPNLPDEWEIIALPPEEENYNCFVLAFDLQKDQEFLGGKNPIQKEFIRFLLESEILEKVNKSSEGSLVFYEDNSGALTHGGIIQEDDRVLSKFMWGPTVRHQLWGVPSSFGDSVFYTNRPPSEEIKTVYEQYRESGVNIRPIS